MIPYHPPGKKTAPSELLKAIQKKAQNCIHSDKTPYRSLMLEEVHIIAQSFDISSKQVQMAALEYDVIPERYIRNQRSLSNKEQIQLLQSHVAVIGLGGLGGFVVEILARIGIWTLNLVDGDRFEESNLNRQLLSSVDNIGKMKAQVATKRIKAINATVDALPVQCHFTADNGKSILEHADIAVDCLDDISARFTLEKVCKNIGIPMLSAATGETRGQATVIFPEDLGLQSIYGPQDGDRKKSCDASLGALPFAAMAMVAHGALKWLSLPLIDRAYSATSCWLPNSPATVQRK